MNSDKLCINDVLPNEILVTIFEYISDGLMRIAGVCNQWRKLVQTTQSLQNRLKLKIRGQSDLDQLKVIPYNFRLIPRHFYLYHHLPNDAAASLKGPIWNQMSFGSIVLYLERKVDLEDVIYFFKEYQRDLNHLTLVLACKLNNWPLCLKKN